MAVRQFARKARKVRRARSAEATASAAKAHVFAPANVKKIRMEEVDPDREVRYRMPARRVKAGRRAGVDLGAMGLAIWNALKDNVSGYILHIRQNGTLVHVGVELGPDSRRCREGMDGRHADASGQRQQVPDRSRHRSPPGHQRPLVRYTDRQLPSDALDQGREHQQDHLSSPDDPHVRVRRAGQPLTTRR